MDNHTIEPDDETLFRTLVLQGTLTLTAIREEMFPALEGIDDVPLIQKMIEIRNGGEN